MKLIQRITAYKHFDKICHSVVGACIGSFTAIGLVIGASPLRDTSPWFWIAIAAGAMLVTDMVGTLKEVYDHAHLDKHTPDIFDIIATSLGGMVGAISTATFLWYFT